MNEKNFPAGSVPWMMLSPTHRMASPSPTAAITSMRGEVIARTENVRRM